ncbi:MAG: hypothetical protein WDO06_00175 [Actinomycetota bacterium]
MKSGLPVGREHLNLVTNENSESVGIQPGYGIGMVSKIPVKSWHRLELRRSPLGILMVLPVNGKLKRMYIRDHPRCAIAAVLENGWMVINTHLSFVPIFNLTQLLKIKRWVKSLPIRDKEKVIVMGDLNLPWDFFAKGFNWNSLAKQKTFPSWKPQNPIRLHTLAKSNVRRCEPYSFDINDSKWNQRSSTHLLLMWRLTSYLGCGG